MNKNINSFVSDYLKNLTEDDMKDILAQALLKKFKPEIDEAVKEVAKEIENKKQARKLISNKIRCKHCNDVIESKYTHDFKWCKCGKVAVDGGLSYGKRICPSAPLEEHIEDLSEYQGW